MSSNEKDLFTKDECPATECAAEAQASAAEALPHGDEGGAEAGAYGTSAEEIAQRVAKKSRTKKSIIYSIFILFNIAVILIILLLENKSGNVKAGGEIIRIAARNFPYTAAVFGIFIIQMAADTTSFYFLIKQSGTRNVKLSLKTSIIGRYYDKLTPWSTGGQPLQMAYLSTHGLDTATGCAVPFAKSIIKVIAVGVGVLPVLIFSGVSVNIYIAAAAYASIAGALLVPFIMSLFIRHPEWGQRFTRWLIRLLCKLKLVKDYDAQYAKFSVIVENFLKGMGYLSTHRKMMFIIGLMTLVEVFAINSLPFFIMKSFGYQNVDFRYIFVLCLFVSYASYFAPSPGAAGVAELSFYTIFASIISGDYLFWAILFWRIIIYYLPLLAGLSLQVTDSVRALARNYKRKKQL